MQSVFNTALLARLRRQTAESSLTARRSQESDFVDDVSHYGRSDAVASDEHEDGQTAPCRRNAAGPTMTNPWTAHIVVPGDDPNNDIDPDDRGNVDFGDGLSPLPTMPCSWWVRVVLGNPEDVVSVEDAGLCLALVTARLKATVGRQASQDAATACLGPREGGDCGQGVANALSRGPEEEIAAASTTNLWNENLAFPETVGALHEQIEELFGSPGWTAFTALWQKACSIEPPPKRETREAIRRCASDAPAELASKPDQVLPPLPADAPVLEEGLHRELEAMPVKVQAFFLHSPKEPAPWVYRESEVERSEREFLESQGGWTG